jgi:hypothetical protein
MKIKIKNGWYDDSIIAFVRKLSKELKPLDKSVDHPYASAEAKSYLVQLKDGYSLDASGEHTKIWLNAADGLAVMQQYEQIQQLRLSRFKKAGRKRASAPQSSE